MTNPRLCAFSVVENQVAQRIVAGINLSCDHFRAVEYFLESIEKDKMFSAFQCDSFADFKDGMCLSSSRLQNMGHDWKEQNSVQGRRHFSITREEDPFSGKPI